MIIREIPGYFGIGGRGNGVERSIVNGNAFGTRGLEIFTKMDEYWEKVGSIYGK